MGDINPSKKATNEHSVSGTVVLDGSNPTVVETGLGTITSAVATLVNASAPGVGTSVLTINPVGGILNIYAWKVTGTGDTTLIASTGTEVVHYHATGY